MAYKKSTLKKLERELTKEYIKAEAITDAAKAKGRTESLVREVLKGNVPDKNGIIEHIYDYLMAHKKRIEEVSDKINNNDAHQSK